MINGTLYKREIKSSIKLLVILGAVITLYVSVIISMYEPELAKLLDSYVDLLPELMAAVGMTSGATSLIKFMCSYLYGFILVIFPMLFCIFRANGLIAKYVDNNSMVSLLTAPVRRRTIAFHSGGSPYKWHTAFNNILHHIGVGLCREVLPRPTRHNSISYT